jgi:Tfp pilus assembly protein PilF
MARPLVAEKHPPRNQKSAHADDSGLPIPVRLIIPVAIFIFTLAVFSPALRFGLVDWDDDVLILQNPDVWGISLRHLVWMFTTTFMGHYQPLTWLSLAMNFDAGGTKPFGYHFVNILLHAASSVMVYMLSLTLLGRTLTKIGGGTRIAAAALAALLFAVHPLRVESVVWVTERRDVLSAFFLLAGVLCYVNYATASTRRGWWYAPSILLVVLSLLSKAWGITIPAVLLVLDVYPLRRLDYSATGRSLLKLLKEKIPFVVPAIAAAGMSLYAQLSSVGNYVPRSLLYRTMQSFYGLAFYVTKTTLPMNLCPIYEHPLTLDPVSLKFIAPVLGVVAITTILMILRRRFPALLTAWVIYIIVVSPVLGIVQAGPQFVADRYTYVACIPFAILAAAGLAIAASKPRRATTPAVPLTLAIVVVIALVIGTRRQINVWRDTEGLWSAVLEFDPDSRTGLLGMGVLCSGRHQAEAAVSYLRRAHERAPDFAQVTVNLAGAYALAGKRDESLSFYRMATTQPSVSINDLLNIGIGFSALGQYEEAQAAYRRIVTHDPKDGEAHYRLAEALDHLTRIDEAISEYQRAIELLEIPVRAGLANPDVNVEAYLFQLGCQRVRAVLNSRGDAGGVARFQEKLRWLVAR